MNNTKKALMGVAALFVMVFALCVTGNTAIAATKKNVTLYVGEKPNYGFFIGSVKSVTTSNKKVVAVKKKNGKAVLTAKKTGKAKITVKGTYRNSSSILNVTVKKAPTFNVTYTPIGDGYYVYAVKNSSKASVDILNLNFTFYDTLGNAVGTRSDYIYKLGAGKTAYKKMYPYVSGSDIDISKTKVTTTYDRSLNYKYKDYTSKVKYSVTYSNGYVNVTTKTSYNKNGSVYASYGLRYKDAAGNVVGYESDMYNYLYKTKKTYTYQHKMPTGAVSAEFVGKRAMLKEDSK